MFDRFASTDVLVAEAVAVFVVSAVFLVVVGIAAGRRARGHDVGSRLGNLIALVGGAALGTMLLVAPDATVAAPLLLAAGVVAFNRWRVGRRTQAGLLVAGMALPVVIGLAANGFPATGPRAEVLPWLVGAAIVSIAGVIIALRGDPAPAAPAIDAPPGRPGSRAMGSIAAAIREPAMVGPFGLPEIAMLVAFVGTWLLVPLLLPRDAGILIRIGVPSLIGAVLATEAYIRAMPPRSRKAFEAFSWLGEWELASAKATVGGIPTNPSDAERWLDAHRADAMTDLEELPIRIQILLLAGRLDEARQALERLPVLNAWDRFDRAALSDLVDWRAGGEGDLAAMEAAAQEILPRDGDERLRADVTVAVAKVRRRMADGRTEPGDAAQPLLDVRPSLGRRADGQVGRALRRRLIPVLLVVSLGFGFVTTLLGSVGS